MDINNHIRSLTVTKPMLLLEVRLGFETLYLSTAEDADWGETRYIGGMIVEGSISYDGDTFSVGLANENNQRTRDALFNRYLGGQVKVWEINGVTQAAYLPAGYVEPGYEEGSPIITPVPLFTGSITDTPRADHILQISCSRHRQGTFPRVRINTPLANFTSRSGTVISVGGRIYTVTQRGGGR